MYIAGNAISSISVLYQFAQDTFQPLNILSRFVLERKGFKCTVSKYGLVEYILLYGLDYTAYIQLGNATGGINVVYQFAQDTFQTLNILLDFVLEREGFICTLSKYGLVECFLLYGPRSYSVSITLEDI